LAYVPAGARLFSFATPVPRVLVLRDFISGSTAGAPIRNSANELSGRKDTLTLNHQAVRERGDRGGVPI